ncbi:MAG: GYD domain-containing protein [Candidatus Neomarinimicrobiota bacterium]
MATFFMFGIYSPDALEEMSAERTTKANRLVEGFGGKIKDIYALMGEQDLVLIIDFPDIQSAMKASVALSKLTGISFSTAPALAVDEFDKLIK